MSGTKMLRTQNIEILGIYCLSGDKAGIGEGRFRLKIRARQKFSPLTGFTSRLPEETCAPFFFEGGDNA